MSDCFMVIVFSFLSPLFLPHSRNSVIYLGSQVCSLPYGLSVSSVSILFYEHFFFWPLVLYYVSIVTTIISISCYADP